MRTRQIGAAIIFLGSLLGTLGYSGNGVQAFSRARAAAAQALPQVGSSADPAPTARPGILIPSTYHLKFHSDFSGSKLDRSVWATCYPWADPAKGCTMFHHGEYEWYIRSQDHVSGGLLYLTAKRKPTVGLTSTGQPRTYACRSGMVTTFPSFKFTHGIVQIVARMPSVKGMWPALWLAPSDMTFPPEIDIVEHWVRPVRPTGVFYHPISGTHIGAFPRTANLALGWHTFSLIWTRFKLAWFIDGKRVLLTRKGPPRKSMYLIANLANARKPSKGDCGGSLIIKSVKIWQR
jgi:beta-glucanase (GH16 family)